MLTNAAHLFAADYPADMHPINANRFYADHDDDYVLLLIKLIQWAIRTN